MKYYIECPYCSAQYTEEGNGKKERFVCKSCGAANGKEHILKKERTPKGDSQDQCDTQGLEDIKKFDAKDYEDRQDNSSSFKAYMARRFTRRFTIASVTMLIAIIFIMITSSEVSILDSLFGEEARLLRAERKEVEASEEYVQCVETLDGLLASLANKDIESVQNYLVFEISDFFGLEQLEEAINKSFMGDFWGNEEDYTYMKYVSGTQAKDSLTFDMIFTNGSSSKMTFEKGEDGQMRIAIDYLLAKNTVVRCDCLPGITASDVRLFIDEEEVDLEPELWENDHGYDQVIYTIPVLIVGQYDFAIEIGNHWTYIGDERVFDNERDIYLHEKIVMNQ